MRIEQTGSYYQDIQIDNRIRCEGCLHEIDEKEKVLFMKGQYADRECPICQTMIPGIEKICPYCKNRVGRVSPKQESPGSYKDWIKRR